jgi:hypothetical protein
MNKKELKNDYFTKVVNAPLESESSVFDDNPKYWGGRWVYLLNNPLSQLTKIGCTRTRELRFKALQSLSGVPITHVISVQLEKRYDESAGWLEEYLHDKFKDKRVIGEWFQLDKNDIKLIKYFFWECVHGWNIDDSTQDKSNKYNFFNI